MVSGRSLTPQLEGAGEAHGHLDGAVGVVALAHVQQAGQAQQGAVVVAHDAVLAAAQGQDEGAVGRVAGVVGEVVAAGLGAVAAADDEEAGDVALLDGVDDGGGGVQDDAVVEADGDLARRCAPAGCRWPWRAR